MNVRSKVTLAAFVVGATFVAGCSGGGGGGPTLPGGSSPTPGTSSGPTHAPTATPTSTAHGTPPTPTPTPTTQPSAVPLSEPARNADAFVNAIGMNVHLGQAAPYETSNFPAIVALLEGLGVRHLRDSAYATANTSVCSTDLELESRGMHFDYTTDPNLPVADVGNWTSCVGAALESYEGPNEYDIQHPSSDTNWPATLRTYQQNLYGVVKGNSASANTPVLGPTFTTENAYQTVGDLSSALDYGNMHDGFSGYNPGTPGYGSHGYGSIAYNVMLSQFVSATKPIIASESGYTTAAMVDGVTPAIQAKYMPRLFFDFFNAGIVRTYEYELLDEPAVGGLTGSFGIVTSSLAPKPAYTAIASLVALLGDPGPTFPAPTVAYGIGGAPLDMRHTLLQKRDGSLYLALWREYEGWDPNKQTPITEAPVTILVEFRNAPTSVTQYSYDSTERLQPTSLPPSSTIQVTVSDSITLLHVVPGPTAASASRIRLRP